jgi:hypothetical protein
MHLLAALVAATTALSLSHSPATSVFVSSSTGDDGNSGDAPTSAWRSLERVSAAAPALGAGSSINLLAGDVWTIDTAWFVTDMAGTASAPIILRAYGASSRRPAIVRNASVPAAGPTITINNSSGIVVAGLEVRGGENGLVFTNDVRSGEAASTFDYFVVTDCMFSNIRGLHYNASSGSWWGSAIAVAAAHSGVTLTNVNISHNLCNASDVFYINSVPYSGWTRSYVAGLLVHANTITHASYNTLFLDTTAFVTISRNVFAHNTPQQLFVAGTTDIIMGTLNASVVLLENEISWRGEYRPGGPDGCAVDFETFADGVSFVGNYVYRSFGAGIMVFGHGRSSINLRVANNTMLYNGCEQTRDDRGGIAFMFTNSSGAIAGNTFATCAGVPLFYAREPGATDGWTFSDNIIDGTGGVSVAALAPPDISATRGAAGEIVLAGSCPGGGDLRYSTDGARPMPDDAPWPPSGASLTLPPRTVAVNAKCFPPPAGSPAFARLGAALGATHIVESPVGGGIFATAPMPVERR